MPLYEMRKFVAPEFIFGVGARHRVGFYARNMQARKVLIVTDAGVISAGWLDDVKQDLAEAGIEYAIFSGLTENPKDYEVMVGAKFYQDQCCDVIVALGGGSVIDCAKAIGIVFANGCEVHAFEGVDNVDIPGPPLICIPTTAGTSADISQFSIIVNSPERYKMAIISKSVVPDVALVDPETTLTLQPHLTACTGMDALTHAIEAFVSTANSPVVDVHALAAIELLWNNVEQAVMNPSDLAARENMLLGSLQAGLAFSNASLGAVHAMAHSLGGYLDLPHGECNALLLDHVIRFNIAAEPDRYQRIATVMGLNGKGLSERQRATSITQALSNKRSVLGLTDKMSNWGVKYGDIPDLAHHAVHDACLVTNPRHASLDDLKVIYGEAL
ncbi:iron-containing alcohol dehydrogenase [Shewanella avicenniae]|uniref:Iron-containing alcohol dehydrogenase n=1 Tax=Shewanella avicenniae TaxID=2814294 RepID=A0ABX7QQI1_9GAMM|nr:alcohol dehydrogenase-like regulatory protein ErcA [Shewanella avicenniae]QSX32946.1 iron-containing alcohol dehydrogenase [Shewanella avicenniae]